MLDSWAAVEKLWAAVEKLWAAVEKLWAAVEKLWAAVEKLPKAKLESSSYQEEWCQRQRKTPTLLHKWTFVREWVLRSVAITNQFQHACVFWELDV